MTPHKRLTTRVRRLLLTSLSILTRHDWQVRGFSLRENALVRGANGHVQRKPTPRILNDITLRPWRPWPVQLAGCGLLLVALASPAWAARHATPREPQPAVAVFHSDHFQLHTDLPPADARSLLQRLESVVRMISRYWGRPLRDTIECYVVDDLSHWPPGSLPNPLARHLLTHIGGGTDLQPAGADGRSAVRARVFATSVKGIAEHEVVHAYCCQAFGTCGPEWYKEGMAQMSTYRVPGERAVHCPPDVIRFLHAQPPADLTDLVAKTAFSTPIGQSLLKCVARHAARPSGRPSLKRPDWGTAEEAALDKAKESYHRSWALCHLLCSHKAYRDRFQAFGRSLLTDKQADFEKTFAGDAQQILFEYDFFAARCGQGYRVDLCRWDWDHAFTPLDQRRGTPVQVRAAQGYQASGALVVAGQRYALKTTGSWKTNANEASTTADGNRVGQGRLVGVVYHQYALSEPFDLGAQGVFVAPSSGQLHLRCQDDWCQLADNSGSINVDLTWLQP